MHDVKDVIAVWQSFAPIIAGVVTLVMMKWFSRRWAAATALPPIAELPLPGYFAIALLLVGTLMLMPRIAAGALSALAARSPIPVRLAWWRDHRLHGLGDLVDAVTQLYAGT